MGGARWGLIHTTPSHDLCLVWNFYCSIFVSLLILLFFSAFASLFQPCASVLTGCDTGSFWQTQTIFYLILLTIYLAVLSEVIRAVMHQITDQNYRFVFCHHLIPPTFQRWTAEKQKTPATTKNHTTCTSLSTCGYTNTNWTTLPGKKCCNSCKFVAAALTLTWQTLPRRFQWLGGSWQSFL